MFRTVTRVELAELDMPRADLAEALDCCLEKVRRGHFIVKSICSHTHFDTIRHLLSGPGITFPTFRGDIRDDAEKLRMSIATRRESLLPKDAFSHMSAALLHGLDPVELGTEKVEITRPDYSRSYSDLVFYARDLAEDDVDRTLGSPVTTLARTLADIALDHRLEVSVPLISEGLRERHISKEALRPKLAPGRRGRKRALLALELASELHESAAEAFCAVKFHRHGITGMTPQVTAYSSTGVFIGRNDFRQEEARVIVEVHGVGKYYMHPDGPDTAARQNHQRNMNLINAGFTVFNLTFGDLFRPQIFEQIKKTIAQALGQRHQ
ncbi:MULTISPECIES: hypothetical protein [unclassified Brevibacterium]|uniref:hypothetical protein n=1 Tax=unclassified Brevibacterium TaxID=2614124 RepID=UPI001092D110|nr:hypothetical protein [Brevibacterium sp. S22]TGD31962.1 hypothetical protein EB835_05585 [Brevibacterium sp. S22]